MCSNLFSNDLLEKHSLLYKNLYIGYVENLNDYIDKNDFLIGHIENEFFSFLRRSNIRILYKNEEPLIENKAFYKKDKLKIIDIIKELKINHKKNIKNTFVIEDKKIVNYECLETKCSFEYFKNENLKRKGEVIFDNSNNIVYFYEEKNNLILSKNNSK